MVARDLATCVTALRSRSQTAHRTEKSAILTRLCEVIAITARRRSACCGRAARSGARGGRASTTRGCGGRGGGVGSVGTTGEQDLSRSLADLSRVIAGSLLTQASGCDRPAAEVRP